MSLVWEHPQSALDFTASNTERPSVISAQFIFKPGTYDEEFHRLDAEIEAYVATIPGFLGLRSGSRSMGVVTTLL
jgi:antibiotic biosynthesis monooxygenase (ABM) superfamily enzyme